MSSTGSDGSSTVQGADGEMPDGRLAFLRELVDDNATIAGDVAEIAAHTWAIHGFIPVDGDVIMAEYETYDQARFALDSLSANRQLSTP
jgi:hypothetical protein